MPRTASARKLSLIEAHAVERGTCRRDAGLKRAPQLLQKSFVDLCGPLIARICCSSFLGRAEAGLNH